MQYLSDFFFNLFELLPAFICANNIGSLLKDFLGVKIFNPFSSFHFFSSPCRGSKSSIFRLINRSIF